MVVPNSHIWREQDGMSDRGETKRVAPTKPRGLKWGQLKIPDHIRTGRAGLHVYRGVRWQMLSTEFWGGGEWSLPLSEYIEQIFEPNRGNITEVGLVMLMLGGVFASLPLSETSVQKLRKFDFCRSSCSRLNGLVGFGSSMFVQCPLVFWGL